MNKKRIIVIILRVIMVVVVIGFIWSYYMFFTLDSRVKTYNDGNGESGSISSDLNPLETAIASINDSLPHYKYRKLKDSLEHIKETNKYKNAFLPSGFGDGHYGLYETEKHDSAYYSPTTSVFTEQKKIGTDYYLMLGDYTLNHEKIFFRENGKNYIKYPVWDKITKSEKGATHKTGHYEIKEINVVVAELTKKDNFVANEKRSVYVPISEKTHDTLNWVFRVFQFLGGIWLLYTIIFLPIKFLERIANGDAFNKKNIRSLHFISYTLIGAYFLNIIIPIVLYSCLRKSVPAEFEFSWGGLFLDDIKVLGLSIIILIIARTFAKGYNLQQEQSLTI
jgi:hypothetical protein